MSEWPVAIDGVTETIVTTSLPDGGWNAAALGLHPGEPVTARTWGATRTRRAFEQSGEGTVQFTGDPLAFVRAALTVWEVDEPVLEATDAWVRVSVARLDGGTDHGTEWVEWGLTPIEHAVERTGVRTIERGAAAAVEASVAASRLGVPGYDDTYLRQRIETCAAVVGRTGNERAREALAIVESVAGPAENE